MWHVTALRSFLRPDSIPLYGKATFVYSFISQWTFASCSVFGRCEQCYSAYLCTGFCLIMFLVFLDVYIGVKLLDCMFCMLSHISHVRLLRPRGLQSPRLCSWDSPGKNTEVGCYALLGIFPIQGPNPCLLRCLLQVFPRSTTWEACMFSAAAIPCYNSCWQCMSILISPHP